MIDELMGAYGGRLVIAILGVGVGFLCLIGVLWIMRGRRGPSPFIRGGRNRQPRLQVLDAAAVDARRRLVLVRRDNVEHLIMIGGPTDIVIESGISPTAETVQEPADEPAPRPRVQRETAEVASPVPAAEPRREPVKPRPVAAAAPLPTPTRQPPPSIPAAPAPAVSPASKAPVAGPVMAATTIAQPPAEPTPVRDMPVFDEAADILEAARGRVFQGPTQPVRQNPMDAGAVEPAPQKSLGSDFERILEEEMATNLASRDPDPKFAGVAATEKPRVTGATPEPSLQDEM
ncbi:MAG: flagellar biosynthetic protein FliO, partial [Pseudorhizobium sp.]